MFDYEKVMNELKKNEGIIYEGDSDEEFEDKKSFLQKKNIDNISRDSQLNNNIDRKENNNNMTLNNKVYIIVFLIITIAQYTYFPFSFYTIYNTNKTSFDYYTFFYNLNAFHSNVVNLFNVYREYLFDNRTIVHKEKPFDYLVELEVLSYNTIPNHINYLNYFWAKNIKMNDDLMALVTDDLCAYYQTDYFNNKEECLNKYELVINYDYNTIFINFVQNIRYVKYIAKYRFEKENIVGKLSSEDDTIE